eukprot:Polyplicarium_translucidae@DN4240_c0_g1_i1.p2
MLDLLTHPLLAALALIAAAQQLRISRQPSAGLHDAQRVDFPTFRSFQRTYLIVFFIVMTSDWGFSRKEIGQLFVVGFAASGIFGVVAGAI